MSKRTRTEGGASGSGVTTVTISLEKALLDDSKLVARLCGFKFSYSAYVAEVLRRDKECRLKSLQSP